MRVTRLPFVRTCCISNRVEAVKELGGTGRTHDWELSRIIRREAGVPLFLAGGLNAGNIAAAIDAVQPHGIDLCSSVRTSNRLDAVKLQDFMRVIRKHRGDQDEE